MRYGYGFSGGAGVSRRNINMIMRVMILGIGIIISFAIYPMFSDLFAAGLPGIMDNLTSLIMLLIIIGVMLVLPYVKFAGLGLLLGLFLNYFMVEGVIAW